MYFLFIIFVWYLYVIWSIFRLRHRIIPQELRVDTLVHEHDDIQHPAIMALSIVLGCMDDALQESVKKKYGPKMKDDLRILDKINNYETVLKLVSFTKLLIIWHSNLSISSVPDEGYSRNMSSTLNLISVFIVQIKQPL
jgi:hypothetical protein